MLFYDNLIYSSAIDVKIEPAVVVGKQHALRICILPHQRKCNSTGLWFRPIDDFVDDEPSVKKPCVGEKGEENLSPDERWVVVYHFLSKIQLL